jgi:hypothetical protein
MKQDNSRLVQLIHPRLGRRVALVSEPSLSLIEGPRSVYELAIACIKKGKKIQAHAHSLLSGESLDYSPVYEGKSEWKLMPCFDHPGNPAACMVSGTGLTHKNSALNRQVMHGQAEHLLTDSMKMYQWGLAGGHPPGGSIGVQPEWFFKGTGGILVAHGDKLELPAFGDDGGEEPELAGIYIVDKAGGPWRIGVTTGNEFSDHVMEKKNYLYLAPSKLRNCSIGPELVLTADLREYTGTVTVLRDGTPAWSKAIRSGEDNMAHSIANIEHHHFKYPGHRVPFQAHVHFFGADAFSFGEQIKLEDGDEMIIHWEGLGRPLKNTLSIRQDQYLLQEVKALA